MNQNQSPAMFMQQPQQQQMNHTAAPNVNPANMNQNNNNNIQNFRQGGQQQPKQRNSNSTSAPNNNNGGGGNGGYPQHNHNNSNANHQPHPVHQQQQQQNMHQQQQAYGQRPAGLNMAAFQPQFAYVPVHGAQLVQLPGLQPSGPFSMYAPTQPMAIQTGSRQNQHMGGYGSQGNGAYFANNMMPPQMQQPQQYSVSPGGTHPNAGFAVGSYDGSSNVPSAAQSSSQVSHGAVHQSDHQPQQQQHQQQNYPNVPPVSSYTLNAGSMPFQPRGMLSADGGGAPRLHQPTPAQVYIPAVHGSAVLPTVPQPYVKAKQTRSSAIKIVDPKTLSEVVPEPVLTPRPDPEEKEIPKKPDADVKVKDKEEAVSSKNFSQEFKLKVQAKLDAEKAAAASKQPTPPPSPPLDTSRQNSTTDATSGETASGADVVDKKEEEVEKKSESIFTKAFHVIEGLIHPKPHEEEPVKEVEEPVKEVEKPEEHNASGDQNVPGPQDVRAAPSPSPVSGQKGDAKSAEFILSDDSPVTSPPNEPIEDPVPDTSRGLLTYTREMLLKFSRVPAASSTPEWLTKQLSIIKKIEPMQQQQNRNLHQGHRNDSQQNMRGDNRGGRDGRGGGQHGGGMPRVNSHQVVIDLGGPVNYVPSENAFVPAVKRRDVVLDADEQLLKDVKILLNKLTPQNSDKLTTQLLGMEFNQNEKRLAGTVDLIFEKALDEMNYAETYSRLCKAILDAEQAAKTAAGAAGLQPFRSVLLRRAQQYFEKTDKEVVDAETKPTGPETPQEKLDALDKQNKARRRYFGNIRFISELYKAGMLTEKVILSCYSRLLPKSADFSDLNEEKVECLTKLLMTTGQAAATTSHDHVEFFFGSLQKMVDAKVGSSRLRFLMLDAIDLKKNNYVGRKTVAPSNVRPMTKAELAEQNKKLEADKRRDNQDARDALQYGGGGNSRNQPQDVRSQRGNNAAIPPNTRNMMAGTGGGGGGGGNQRLSAVNTSMSKSGSVPNQMSQMGGQNQGGGRGQNVGGGKTGNMGGDMGGVKSIATAPKPNKFFQGRQADGASDAPMLGAKKTNWSSGSGSIVSAARPPTSQRPGENRSAASSRDNSRSRVEAMVANRRPSQPSTAVGGGSGVTINLYAPATDSPLISRSTTPQESPRGTPSLRSPVNEELSEESMEREIKHMTMVINAEDTDYNDVLKEAVEAVNRMSETQKAQVLAQVMQEAPTCVYNVRTQTERRKLGILLLGLTKAGCFSQDNFITGLGSNVVSTTEDMEADVPSLYTYFVECVAPLAVETTEGEGYLGLDTLEQILRTTTPELTAKYHAALHDWFATNRQELLPQDKQEKLLARDANWSQYLTSSSSSTPS